jgi:hypothetical protein
MTEDRIKMIAIIRSTVSDEVLNVLENSAGYEEVNLKKDPHAFYQFIIDIIYYKINTNAHIQTTHDIILEIYNIKQGPTEEILTYQHRAVATKEMIKRTQERHTKFLADVDRVEENIIPGDTLVMYSVLRGLNENYASFKMDVSNRMQHDKGNFPYTDITNMLNHAAEFHSITSSKGKALISFASTKDTNKGPRDPCTHCRGKHPSDQCWREYPSLKPAYKSNNKSISAHKSESP